MNPTSNWFSDESRCRSRSNSPAAARMRRYRERLRASRRVFPVELGPEQIAVLIRAGILAERDANDDAKVGQAVARVLLGEKSRDA
jgi:hypothetical protein